MFVFAATAASAQTGPFVQENATVKIAPHSYVIPDRGVGGVPNVGFVVGTRATLVIDTGMGARNGEAVLREMRKVSTNAEVYLATTHVHPEHDLGAHAFPASVKMIRSRDQIRDIEEFKLQTADAFRNRSAVNAELLQGAEFRKADLVFDREHVLDLGGVRVTLNAVGPAHTRGDTSFWVDGDRVLFAGDLAMPNLPAFASPYSSVRVWLASLEKFMALRPVRVVPSHGNMGDVQLIADYQTYLQTLQRRARELKAAGRTADQTAEQLTKELQEKYADRQPARIGPAARAAWTESQ